MKNNNFVVSIMCGGNGSRLWPKSRTSLPKQFLKLVDKKYTMFQMSCLNVINLNPKKYIIICNEQHTFIIEEQLKDINISNYIIVGEPFGKDTCAAIAVATYFFEEDDKLLVLTADHVWNKDILCESIKKALENENSITLVGIKPTYAETGYGYINYNGDNILSFKEKPNKEIAEEYFKNGHYLWNSGIFILPNRVIKDELIKHENELCDAVRLTIDHSEIKDKVMKLNKDYFSKVKSISVDFAIMEKQKSGKIICYDGYWCDIGSFESLYNNSNKDNEGNILSKDVIQINTKNCYIESEKLVAVIGLEDLIIVDSRDALLITKKEDSQLVKNVVKTLVQQGRQEIICHSKVFRPWGWYLNIEGNDHSGFKVKRIGVNPGKRLSLQSHYKRSEHWVITKGIAKVQVGMDFITLHVNQHVYIPKETLHRMENIGEEMVEFIETQIGEYLGEDDIVRYDDDFGRL